MKLSTSRTVKRKQHHDKSSALQSTRSRTVLKNSRSSRYETAQRPGKINSQSTKSGHCASPVAYLLAQHPVGYYLDCRHILPTYLPFRVSICRPSIPFYRHQPPTPTLKLSRSSRTSTPPRTLLLKAPETWLRSHPLGLNLGRCSDAPFSRPMCQRRKIRSPLSKSPT